MEFLKGFVFVLLLSTAFIACKKDNDKENNSASSAQFIGKWVGTYGFDNEVPDNFFSMNIKSDGVIQELNSSGVAKGQGTWIMQGTILKGTYKMLFSPYNEYSVIATVNQASGKIEGSWGYDKNGSDGGKIILAKQ